jgi:hypothetical protein
MNTNTIYRYNYIKNKKLDTDEIVYKDQAFDLIADGKECDNNVPGFNFWKLEIKGATCPWIEKITKGREYLNKDIDWLANYDSAGAPDISTTDCISEGKYKIRLSGVFTVNKRRYPSEFIATVYNVTGPNRVTNYNSIREIHKIKNNILFSTDYFLEKKMFLTVKNKHYDFHDLRDGCDDIIFLKEQPKIVEAYEKEKLLYTLTINYDEYGLVKEIYKDNDTENRALYKAETNYIGDVSIESTYFLFLDKFDISRNELIDKAIVKEKLTITSDNYIYTRELLIPEV